MKFAGALKLQSDGTAEECGDRGHLAAGGEEDRHELWAIDLAVGDVHRSTEIAKLGVLHEFVVGGEATWGAAEVAGIIPVQEFADSTPFPGGATMALRTLKRVSKARDATGRPRRNSRRLKMEIKAGRVNVLDWMGKAHGDARLVGALVMREARVAVNAKQRAARRAGSATR
jgi:hypothetical protein